MEEMTLDAVDAGKNAQSLLFNLQYQPHFLESMTLGVAAGDFQAEKAADFHTQELNTYLSYQYKQIFHISHICISPTYDRTNLSGIQMILLPQNSYAYISV